MAEPTRDQILGMVEAAYNTGWDHHKAGSRLITHRERASEDGAQYVRRMADERLFGTDGFVSPAAANILDTEAQPSLVVMFEADGGKIHTILRPRPGDTYGHFALLAADLVRHIANACQVDEDAVWEIVDRERERPTTSITDVKPS